jgi:hypothetical protein
VPFPAIVLENSVITRRRDVAMAVREYGSNRRPRSCGSRSSIRGAGGLCAEF